MRRAKWGIRKRGRRAACPWQVTYDGQVRQSFVTWEAARNYVAKQLTQSSGELITLLAQAVRAS